MPLIETFTDSAVLAGQHTAHHNELAKIANNPMAPNRITLANGAYYDNRLIGNGTTNAAITASTCYFLPYFFPWACTIDRVGSYFTTAGSAGATMRAGWYAPAANGLPGTLLVDWGTTALDGATGFKEVAAGSGLAVAVGWKWLGIATSDVTPGNCVYWNSRDGFPVLIGSTAANPLAGVSFLRVATTGGVLPTSPPTTQGGYTIATQGTSAPGFSYRVP